MLWSRELISVTIWHPDHFVKSQVGAYIWSLATDDDTVRWQCLSSGSGG